MRHAQLAMFGLSAGIVAAGCAGTKMAVAPVYTNAPTLGVIQRIGYGPDARFARCGSGVCPARTVKTLAPVEHAPTPVIAHAPAPPPEPRAPRR